MPILLTLISVRIATFVTKWKRAASSRWIPEFQLEILDVDAEQISALYGDLVPVLLHEKRELCHYFP